MFSCLCIGAAHIDSKLCCKDTAILETSNPIHSYSSHGGVARNVCENIARQGIQSALISRVGDDVEGLSVVHHLDRLGVSTRGITRSNRFPTAKYTSVLNPNGEMVIACADMNIYEELTPDLLTPILQQFKEVPLWILDMNLPLETVEAVRNESSTGNLWLLSVSIPKVLLYRQRMDLLGQFEGLSINREELAALLDYDCQTQKDIENGCFQLHDLGIQKILVTMGKEGALLSNQGVIFHQPAEVKSIVVDTTGAGDAFIAGVLCGLVKQLAPEECVSYGMKLALSALSRRESVSNITE